MLWKFEAVAMQHQFGAQRNGLWSAKHEAVHTACDVASFWREQEETISQRCWNRKMGKGETKKLATVQHRYASGLSRPYETANVVWVSLDGLRYSEKLILRLGFARTGS